MPNLRGNSCCCKKVSHCNQCPNLVIVLSLPNPGDSEHWCGLTRKFEFCGEISSGGLPSCDDSGLFKYLVNYGGHYIVLDITAACMDGLISESSSQTFIARGQWTKDPTVLPPGEESLIPGTKEVQLDAYLDASLFYSGIRTVNDVVPNDWQGAYYPCPTEQFLQITCRWPCNDPAGYLIS